MSEILKKKKGEEFFLTDWSKKFLFIEKFKKPFKLDGTIELCILETNFSKPDVKFIKTIKKINPHIEFWISTNFLSRENILLANKLGINNVISSPYDKGMVEEFFNNKNNSYINKKNMNEKYDYSSIKNSKIMIVDDNMMNIELLKEILSAFNVEIQTFLKPKEALKVMQKEKFDLILLDIMMPEMSGFELANKIKKIKYNKNTGIIFISALSDSHNKITGYNLGSLAYIEKPFDINIVKSQIYNYLKTKKTEEVLINSKESFWASVAHDLKTPINAEINALNLLLDKTFGELRSMQSEIIEDVLNSTKFMKDIVENVLCKNKIENNKIVLSKEVHSINEVIYHCIEASKHLLKPKNQKIQFEFNNENILLPLDFIEIKRAILNIIANANEYSTTNSKIIIKITKTESKVNLIIQDFGKGIDIEKQEDIFSQYITYAKKYKKVGTGLGLYIAKEIIEAHNGKISLESKPNKGTTVTISLPIYDKE